MEPRYNRRAMQPAVATYREYAPCAALKRHVRAFFSYLPGTGESPPPRPVACEFAGVAGDCFSPPVFADGHISMAFNLGMICHADGLWRSDPAGCHGKVTGAVTRVDPVGVERAAMIGIYFHAAQAASITSVAAHELTDRIVHLEEVWGSTASELPERLAEMNEATRIETLESILVRRIRDFRSNSVDIPRLAASVIQRGGQVTVESLAFEAGVSRQHMTRLFREVIGISPKLYCRLARFQSGLAYAGCGDDVDWAQAALDMGYADQSHMIAEFREFSSLTPQMLASRRWIHPFIERAKHAATHDTRIGCPPRPSI